MRTNYHTHTERCNHAKGSDEESVLSAIRGIYDNAEVTIAKLGINRITKL